MSESKRSAVRHLSMRLALGLVLGWFGINELHSPSGWSVFVPSYVVHHYPNAVTSLVTFHGFLLVLAAGSILAGVLCVGGSLLAAGLLGEVILDLWIGGGLSDTLIRDVGLLGLAGALTLDPVRVWHLDGWLLSRLRPVERTYGKKKHAKASTPAPQAPWPARAGSGAALLASAGALALVLRVTGAGGAPALDNSTALSAAHQPSATATAPGVAVDAPTASAQPTSDAAATPPVAATPADAGQPTAKPSVLFANWRYRNSAFQVYPGDISSDARNALAGFDVTVQDQGSSVLLTFKALSTRYHDATITVAKGNTAYFIETSMRDDENNQETELNDDGVVVVDPQGYLLQS